MGFTNILIESIAKHGKIIINWIVIIIFLSGMYWIYQTFFEYHVYVRFKELGPLTKNMPVYYKGFIVGRVRNIGPDDDYKASIVKIIINEKNIKLPANTFVIVQKFPNEQNYLEFIYPDKPSLRFMSRGDILEGIAHFSIEQFMHGQVRMGTSDIVSENVLKALSSAEKTNLALQDFFSTASVILKENRQNIKQTVKNTTVITSSLAQAAKNTSDFTENLVQATQNISESSKNFKTTTTDVNEATKNLGKTSEKIDSIITDVQQTASNLNKITTGIYRLLCKRFAGVRIFLGRPIPQDKCQDTCP